MVAAVVVAVAPPVWSEYNAAAICPGDVLSIAIFEHGDLSSTARVQEDGRIRLPLAGWIAAAGKTPGKLAEELSDAYAKANIERAFATVHITTYGPRTVYVIGEVLEGGKSLEITPPARLSVTQAVSSAGGFTDQADLRHVLVRRAGEAGRVTELAVDVLAVIAGVAGAPDPVLEVGDTVIIPRSKPVYVVGEVHTPGMYHVGTHSVVRCSEVLSQAGGLADTADRGGITIFRHTDADRTEPVAVDMDAVYGGAFAADVHVEPGDMVVVPRRHKVYVFGEVRRPGALEIEPGVTLTAFQAITLSGGFTDYAAASSVLLVRAGTMRTLNLKNPYRHGREVEDSEIRAGDILMVQTTLW